MGTCTINGKTYQGNSVAIVNGVFYIDGVIQTDAEDGTIEIQVVIQEGTLQDLTVKGNNTKVTIKGDVQGRIDASGSVSCCDVGKGVKAGGSVNCKEVSGDVEAGGSIECQAVSGSAKAGGSIRCGKVGGKVKAMGSVRHR